MPENHSKPNTSQPTTVQQYSSFGALFCKLYWLFFGHFAILLTAYFIAISQKATSIIANSIFLLFVVAIIVARYVDIRVYKGETADGEKATIRHWRKFSIIAASYSIALWIAIQVITLI